MAPFKPETEKRYSNAVKVFRDFLINKIEPLHLPKEIVSEVKGLVNRCIRQDQWDWYTVYNRFGLPDTTVLYRTSSLLEKLKTAITSSSWEDASALRRQMKDNDFLNCCTIFLSGATDENNNH